jgi:hypothetical protein
MKKVIASLVALAGMSGAAHAVVNTTITWEVSLTGAANSWGSSVNVSAPNTPVYARARIAYIPGSNGATVVPIGLGSFVFQPTASNATSTDTVMPFLAGGIGSNTSTPIGVLDPTTQLNDNTNFGRFSPWGRSATSSTSALHGFFHTNPNGDGVNYIRIAQLQVTSWIGGTGNTTGGSGVPISQLSDVGRTTSDPAFNGSLGTGDANNPLVYVFKYGIQLDSTAISARVNHDMVIDSPSGGFGNVNSSTGDREIYWFSVSTQSTGTLRGTANVVPATVHFVPAPGSMALLGLGGLALKRRRR